MKRSLALGCVLVGALLILAPVLSSQWGLYRVEAFYDRYGGGALLPEELKPRPYAGYDWACFGSGLSLAFLGLWLGRNPDVAPSASSCP